MAEIKSLSAPDWAHWLAQDEDGAWYWHDRKPKPIGKESNGEGYWSSSGNSMVASRGIILGDWSDTLEQRPVDLSEPAVTERLTEATKTVLAAVPNLLGEQFKFERNTKPVSVSNEIMQLDQPVAVADTGDAGSANAWRSLHEWITDESNNPQMALMEQVSSELHNDGCFSAWIHLSRFIEALFERIDDLGAMTSGITDRQDEQPKPDSDWFERGALPPVGVECEAFAEGVGPEKCKIIAYHKNQVAVQWFEFNDGCLDVLDRPGWSFRQLRKNEDRDALMAVLACYSGALPKTHHRAEVADAILAAGFKREGSQ